MNLHPACPCGRERGELGKEREREREKTKHQARVTRDKSCMKMQKKERKKREEKFTEEEEETKKKKEKRRERGAVSFHSTWVKLVCRFAARTAYTCVFFVSILNCSGIDLLCCEGPVRASLVHRKQSASV